MKLKLFGYYLTIRLDKILKGDEEIMCRLYLYTYVL